MKKSFGYYSDDDDGGEILLVSSPASDRDRDRDRDKEWDEYKKGEGDIVVMPQKSSKVNNSRSVSSVVPTGRSQLNDDDEDLDDEYGYPIFSDNGDGGGGGGGDDDSVESHDDKSVGIVGMKWRTRILRVLDSDEQWKGICEIYFHWKCDKDNDDKGGKARRRRKKRLTEKEKYHVTNIEQPDKCPVFIILNEEDSNSIEEMYYVLPGFPDMMFGYVAWTVVVHERLELERYPFDRQFFKLEIECTNGKLVPWTYDHIPSLVKGRIDVGSLSCNFFSNSDTPSWQLDILSVTKGNRPSVYIMSIGMTRLTGFYISNIALPYFLIGTAAVLTTAIEPEDYGSRFESMIALYLTLVAIKFVASFLPVISYSTLLDHYTLIAYFFLASWMIENFAVSPLFFDSDQKEIVRKIDHTCAFIYISLWVLLHFCIVLGSTCDMFRKTWHEVQCDDEAVDPTTHKEVTDITEED